MRSILLAVSGLLMIGTLHLFSGTAPIAAANTAILRAHMAYQAYELSPPHLDISIRIIGFDEKHCSRVSSTASSDPSCSVASAISRADLANAVGIAREAKPRAIFIDFHPFALPGGCTDGARALTRAIIDASRTVPVILLVNALQETNGVWRIGPSFLDQCSQHLTDEDRSLLSGSGPVLFGHGLLHRTVGHGPVDRVTPWITADMPRLVTGATDSPFARRHIPAASLLVAMVLAVDDTEALLAALEGAGLETRWKTTAPFQPTVNVLRYCRNDTDCHEIAIDQQEAFVRKLSYRVGWSPQDRIGSTAEQRARLFSYISAADITTRGTVRGRDVGVRDRFVVVIGANDQRYGDMHVTPIGILPGVAVHANAAVDYYDGFAQTERTFLRQVIEEALALTAFTVVLYVLSKAVVTALRNTTSLSEGTSTEIAWFGSLFVLSAIFFVVGWRMAQTSFSQGVVYFALAGMIVAILDIRTVLERLLSAILTWASKRLRREGKSADPV